jgi:two-component system, LytTR family, response regulator
VIEQTFRVLIVDDEALARQRLVTLLARVPDIDIVGECQNGLEAVASIRTNQPDLVFLDVQMPELDGFDVITEVGTDKMPPVIFVTAFDDYAVSAFEFGAFDYLLKPVDHVRFHQTLDRAKKRLKESPGSSVSSQLTALLKYVGQLDAPKNRIGVKVNGKILFLDPDEIFWIQARDDLARIHLAEVAYDVREPLSRLEARLPQRFLRVHRSTIVNTAQVREAQPFDQGDQLLILRNGKRITTGRSYRKAVQDFLKRAT